MLKSVNTPQPLKDILFLVLVILDLDAPAHTPDAGDDETPQEKSHLRSGFK